ncbi:hypothetical protein RZS08_60410, partial [Arthrospira platensis SPKY1]|nr:hypothetical protein [Arthrospira platensis SPKY1]
ALTGGKLQELDVAGVKDVETPVGEDDALPPRPVAAEVHKQVVPGAQLVAGPPDLAQEISHDLLPRHRLDSELHHLQASGDVGQAGCLLVAASCGQHQGDDGDHHVSGPHVVEHLA